MKEFRISFLNFAFMSYIQSILLCLGLIISVPIFAQVNETDEHGRKQGQWIKQYPNGKIRYKGNFLNDKPVGTFQYFNEQGKLTAENTFYANGLKAKGVLYNEHGKRIAEGIYIDQKKDSVWNYFKYDTLLIAKETYKNGKPHGTWFTWYENGKPAEEVSFIEGVQTGPYKQYFENGNLKIETTYLNGAIDGSYVQYHSDGKKLVEGVYKKDLKSGEWKSYNTEGKIEFLETYGDKGERIEQKLINGTDIEYFDLLMPKHEITYVSGKKNGPFKVYYESGEWKTRKVDGEGNELRYERYLEGQQVKVVGKYFNDEYHGKITWYNLDGTIEKEEYYQYGKKTEQ